MSRGSADLTSEPELLGFDGQEDTSDDRKHGRRAAWMTFGLLAIVIAVAVPVIAYLTKPKPGSVHAPVRIAGLTLDRQSAATNTAEYLRNAVAAGMSLDASVGAVYTDGSGDAHSVIFVGGATTTGTVKARLGLLFSLLDDGADGVTNVTHEPAGKLGGLVNCATTTDSTIADASTREAMAVCAWSDSKTVGLAMFPNRGITEAAGLFGQMRPALESHN
jgi:hypothetical protein